MRNKGIEKIFLKMIEKYLFYMRKVFYIRSVISNPLKS